MIDLHCHILPALDDGALDLEDAVAMAAQAQADGITAICATPHVRADHDVRIADLPSRLERLQGAVRSAGIETAILPGGEVAADRVAELDRAELAAVSLGGGGRWILLEPSPGPLDDRLEHAVEVLERHRLRAVIAHPERHLGADLIARLQQLTERGALVQATAAFLVDQPTRMGMLTLADGGLIHVLGSDAHSSHAGRRVELSAALEVLSRSPRIGPHLEWVAGTAPAAIVAGEELTPPFAAS
jgi:protein-tyrosine phosphatase